MPRRRTRKKAFNTKLIIDVAGASLIVEKMPSIIQSFVELDPTVSQFAGIGAGYVAGMLLKRPDLQNASIALGIVNLVSPMIDDLIGGGGIENLDMEPSGSTQKQLPPESKKNITTDDYVSLNDYVSENEVGSKMAFPAYRDSY